MTTNIAIEDQSLELQIKCSVLNRIAMEKQGREQQRRPIAERIKADQRHVIP